MHVLIVLQYAWLLLQQIVKEFRKQQGRPLVLLFRLLGLVLLQQIILLQLLVLNLRSWELVFYFVQLMLQEVYQIVILLYRREFLRCQKTLRRSMATSPCTCAAAGRSSRVVLPLCLIAAKLLVPCTFQVLHLLLQSLYHFLTEVRPLRQLLFNLAMYLYLSIQRVNFTLHFVVSE